MDLDRNFSQITSALKEEFKGIKFTEEEVRECLTSREEFVELICRKTGLPKQEVSHKVQQLLSRFETDSDSNQGFMAKVTNKVEGTMESLKEKF